LWAVKRRIANLNMKLMLEGRLMADVLEEYGEPIFRRITRD
jgi:hypothetical protein